MATGTIRFWAAARAATGVADEPYDAGTLAEALAAARARHGDALAKVLDRCSYVVDDAPVGGRAHESVRLTDGGSIEVLPPFAGGADAQPAAVRPEGLPVTVAGIAAGLVAAAVAGLALLGIGPLAAGVFVVQIVIALAWLAVLDVKGAGGGFVIVIGTSAVMDSLLGSESEPDIGRAAGTVGVALVVCLLYQLARRPRVSVTLSLAGAVSAIAFACCAASYIALRVESDGQFADVAALLGAGVALAVARVVDLAVARPAAAPGSRRGVAGIVVGVGAALLVGWAYGSGCAELGVDHAVRLALVASVIALIADLAIDSVLNAAPPADDRARSALAPLTILLPVALAGPAAYVAGRILLG